MCKKTMSRHHRSSSCFCPPSTDPPPSTIATTKLTTPLYHTRLGTFTMTWTRTFIGRSLHLHLLPNPLCLASSISSSFRLNLNPVPFWKKHGSHKLLLSSSPVTILWDLTNSTFGSGPEPQLGFYIAVSDDSELVFLVGDLCPTTLETRSTNHQALVVRREHVFGTMLHRTNTMSGDIPQYGTGLYAPKKKHRMRPSKTQKAREYAWLGTLKNEVAFQTPIPNILTKESSVGLEKKACVVPSMSNIAPPTERPINSFWVYTTTSFIHGGVTEDTQKPEDMDEIEENTHGKEYAKDSGPEKPIPTTNPPNFNFMELIPFQCFWGFVGPEIVNFVKNWWDGRASIAGIGKTIYFVFEETSMVLAARSIITDYAPAALEGCVHSLANNDVVCFKALWCISILLPEFGESGRDHPLQSFFESLDPSVNGCIPKQRKLRGGWTEASNAFGRILSFKSFDYYLIFRILRLYFLFLCNRQSFNT